MKQRNKHSFSPRCVVLFDIDGTLVSGPFGLPSAGLQAMKRATAVVVGPDVDMADIDFAGRTDLQIARMILQAGGRPEPSVEEMRRLIALYIEYLREEIAAAPYRFLGEPAAAVECLRNKGAVIGIGTGNVRAGAQIKVESAGIAGLFELERGGYGDDGEIRAEVLQAGARRCDSGGTLPVVVVGDTPHDVTAAHAIGAYCIAVPFGRYDRDTLARAGADRVIEGIDAGLGETVAGLLAHR